MKKVLLWGIGILLVAFGGYYIWNEIGYITAKPISDLATEDTSTWKTYTNAEFGYTIKYPQDYILTDAADYNSNDDLKVAYPHAVNIKGPNDKPNESRFYVTVIRQKAAYSHKYYNPESLARRSMAGGLFNTVSFSSVQKVNVGDGRAMFIAENGMAGYELDSKHIVALRGEFAYTVSWEPIDHPFFQTMGSTFKLIK